MMGLLSKRNIHHCLLIHHALSRPVYGVLTRVFRRCNHSPSWATIRKNGELPVKVIWPLHRTSFNKGGSLWRRGFNSSYGSAFGDKSYPMTEANRVTPAFLLAEKYTDRVALVDVFGCHSYSELLHKAHRLADRIARDCERSRGDRIVILCPNDVSYVVAKWASWICEGIAVPLSPSHPDSELDYFLHDSRCQLVITTAALDAKIGPISEKLGIKTLTLLEEEYSQKWNPNGRHHVAVEELDTPHRGRQEQARELLRSNSFKHQPALIVYTSGTTGRPKGVVHTHGNIQAQMENMIEAWGWTSSDIILHVLPLHHVHGIVNVLMTPLYCGATCVMLPKFDASEVWSALLNPCAELGKSINLFMAVPTVYAKLLENHEERFPRHGRKLRGRGKDYVKAVCSSKIRLMVSGSAALPEHIMEKWREVTGHLLLERYGMTELGMALGNPLHGDRHPGCVGRPFPSVEVSIGRPNAYSATGYDMIVEGTARRTRVMPGDEDQDGELFVKGPSVFKEYWDKPDATREAFTTDGWYKTGDTACFKDGVYRILGRTSVDIIKSGGYKISALDVERHLLAHEDIKEVAVVGLPDVMWGQKVAAVIVPRAGAVVTLADVTEWARERIPSYQVPSAVKTLAELPKNAMGKVNKKQLISEVFANEMKNKF